MTLLRLRSALLSLLLGASAAACAGSDHPDDGSLLAAGAMAPELSKVAHDGTSISLRELGAPSVVYFYPKDDTPGCTAEACAFRDAWARYGEAGVKIIGVSADTDDSHRAFATKYELPFPLVADTDLAWANAFGVPTRGGMPKRVSFLLDRTGKIAEVWPGVDPGVHAEQVLTAAAKL